MSQNPTTPINHKVAIELPNYQKQSATQVFPAACARETWREAVSDDFGSESAVMDRVSDEVMGLRFIILDKMHSSYYTKTISNIVVVRFTSSMAININKNKGKTKQYGIVLVVVGLLLSQLIFIPNNSTQALPGEFEWRQAGNLDVANLEENADWQASASSSDGSRLVVTEAVGPIYTSADFGETWIERTSAGSRNWQWLASSADGSKIAAVEVDGYLYTSDDFGETWTAQTGAGMRNWQSIAYSADGSKMVAATAREANTESGWEGELYTSTDSGVTWTERLRGDGLWRSVVSSANGEKLAVVATNGYIYTSDDSGVTWTERTSAGKRKWITIATSVDGNHLVASVGNGGDGYIYTSNDAGETWVERTSEGIRYWRPLSISQDGSRIIAGDRNYGLLYGSTDYGETWKQLTAGAGEWWSVFASTEGENIIAIAKNRSVRTSSDYGETWVKREVTGLYKYDKYWSSIASSADGTKLVAVDQYGYIYTSSDGGVNFEERIDGLPSPTDNPYWTSLVSSADGKTLAATNGQGNPAGGIYVSRDFGVTWSQYVFGLGNWQSVAMSADGTKLAATTYSSVYISTNSGVTWEERPVIDPDLGESNVEREFYDITSSADGTKLVLAGYFHNYDTEDEWGVVYTSTDSGVTWAEHVPDDGTDWYKSIVSSADGTRLVAMGSVYDADVGDNYNVIYTSADAGATWTYRTNGLPSLPDLRLSKPYLTTDGAKLFVSSAIYDNNTGEYSNSLYVSSDLGKNWTEHQMPGSGYENMSIVASPDGTKLVAVSYNGPIYLATQEGPATATFDLVNSLTPAPSDVRLAVSDASLSIASSTCYSFEDTSIKSLSSANLTTGDDRVSLAGGLAFNISCATVGGSTPLTITLGEHYADTSQLRVYKTDPNDATKLVDITSQVTIQNTTGGKPATTVSYTLVDGGDYDEDRVANGVIVDPIYFGLLSSMTDTTSDSLAETGDNVWLLLVAGLGMVVGGAAMSCRFKPSFLSRNL